jgi:oligoribonuclease NrnB/cAMP/cGMP phosphodiesterase (DHH superfamily)
MRLLTRADFDGLTCAALLTELHLVDQVKYVHPKDIQDNCIPVDSDDILANVPYTEGCGLWFDHHTSEAERLQLMDVAAGVETYDIHAPSTASIIYRYYQSRGGNNFRLKRFKPLIEAVNRANTAQYSHQDVVSPEGWALLAMLTDPRSGIGYRPAFKQSYREFLSRLPAYLRAHSIEDILAKASVQEYINLYLLDARRYESFILDHAAIEGDLLILDMRGENEMPIGNRFVEYALFPAQNVSIRLVDTRSPGVVMMAVGHSIVNRSATVDVGTLVLKYGGGGHQTVGTCQVPYEEADDILLDMVAAIRSHAPSIQMEAA